MTSQPPQQREPLKNSGDALFIADLMLNHPRDDWADTWRDLWGQRNQYVLLKDFLQAKRKEHVRHGGICPLCHQRQNICDCD